MTGPVITRKQLDLLTALQEEGFRSPARLLADKKLPEGTSPWGLYVTGAALFRRGLVTRRHHFGVTEFAILKAGLDFLKDVERGRVAIR